jgi:predicted transcriptional regulator
MTLRLPPELDDELRSVAREEHRNLHQAVVHAVEVYLAQRETAQVKADPEALRALAEAREAIQTGDIIYGTDAVHALLDARRTAS